MALLATMPALPVPEAQPRESLSSSLDREFFASGREAIDRYYSDIFGQGIKSVIDSARSDWI